MKRIQCLARQRKRSCAPHRGKQHSNPYGHKWYLGTKCSRIYLGQNGKKVAAERALELLEF